MPPSASAEAGLAVPTSASGRMVPVPRYLEQVFWWACVPPDAVQRFGRQGLVNLISFGTYRRLRNAALAELGETVRGQTLQLACARGNLTSRLARRLAPDANLDVVDILPIQLKTLATKLPADDRIALLQGNPSSLACADASYDQVLLFFLLHQQPEAVRRATLAEAVRVTRPGGRIVILDYHHPVRWHPLRLLMGVLHKLEPCALDLWRNEVTAFMPQHVAPSSITKQTYYGGLYQKLVLIR